MKWFTVDCPCGCEQHSIMAESQEDAINRVVELNMCTQEDV